MWGWGRARTLGLLAVAAVLLASFVLMERRTRSPLVDIAANAKPALLRTNVASVCVGFAMFASFIGTAAYVQAPRATGYGFGTSIVVSGLCMLPSGLAQLALSPVSAVISRRFGPKITLCTGAIVVAAGFASRIGADRSPVGDRRRHDSGRRGRRHRLRRHAGAHRAGRAALRLAAANGLNSLSRASGSSLASAVGGTLLASSVVVVGGAAFPSLAAYQILFALCAIAAALGAGIALLVPYPRGYSPSLNTLEAEPEWRSSEPGDRRPREHRGQFSRRRLAGLLRPDIRPAGHVARRVFWLTRISRDQTAHFAGCT